MTDKPRRMISILSGSKEDLALIRKVRRRIHASSDRETVRRMAIFCDELMQKQADGCEILLLKHDRKNAAVVWSL